MGIAEGDPEAKARLEALRQVLLASDGKKVRMSIWSTALLTVAWIALWLMRRNSSGCLPT